MDLDWLRELIGHARDAGAAVFVKQLGSRWATANGFRGKAGEPDLWPSDLRVRELPGSGELGRSGHPRQKNGRKASAR